MFYCREEELQTMNRRYNKGQFECVVIYGRRRVGKTALINAFCKGKETIYFSALNASSRENLEALSKAIYQCQKPEGSSAPIFQHYDDALLENLFDPASYLFEEPEILLKQELREPAIYNSVISAIAGGASRANEIATKVGLDSNICGKYLRSLLELGILKKETPITEKPGKKTIYAIEDNFFRFWYRFVPRNMSAIHAGRIRQIYARTVKQDFPDYMGLIFEKMCQEYLLRYAENLPILLCDVGQWWGIDAKMRKEIQIDLVGTAAEGTEYLIGSCKYRQEKIGVDELKLLQRYAEVFRPGGKFHFYIFAKNGFTDQLMALAKQGEVTLLTLQDLYST